MVGLGIRKRILEWLLKDVIVDEIRVRKLRVGEGTINIGSDYIDLSLLTSDPALTEGRVWYRSDLGKIRYYDGSVIKELPAVDPIDVYYLSRSRMVYANRIDLTSTIRKLLDLTYTENKSANGYINYYHCELRLGNTNTSAYEDNHVHFKLTSSITSRAYIEFMMAKDGDFEAWMGFSNGNLDNVYMVGLRPAQSASDLVLCKIADGKWNWLGAEGVDLPAHPAGVRIGLLWDADYGILIAYRDGIPRLCAKDTSFTSFSHIFFYDRGEATMSRFIAPALSLIHI